MSENLYESRLRYDKWVKDAFGTADFVSVKDGTATVVDLKYGKGLQVYADDNPQLKLYALGVLQEYGWLYEINTFALWIYQPRLDHVDKFEISTEDLLKWAEEVIVPGGKLALTPGAPFAPGKHCQFCLIKSTCKARAKSVFDSVVGDFDDLDEKTPVESISANELTLAEVGLMLPFLPTITAFCSDLQAHALSEIGKGETISHPETGDYKLVAGRSGRAWKGEEEEVEKALRGKHKLLVKDIYNKKLKTPPQIEKVVGKKHEIMTTLVEKFAGKPVLVPGTDKRESLKLDPDKEFDDD